MSLGDKTDLELDGEAFELTERLYALATEKRRRALTGIASLPPPASTVATDWQSKAGGLLLTAAKKNPLRAAAFVAIGVIYLGFAVMKVFQ